MINFKSPTTFTTAMLVADTYDNASGSVDSVPTLTQVGLQSASVALEIQSTLGALLLPRMTTVQKLALTATNGMMVYDTTLGATYNYASGIWATFGGSVTQINTGTGLTGGPISTIGTISIANTAVTPGSYTAATITVNAQGQLTAASTGTTAVTPGSYTYTSLTVNATGQLTAASSGVSPVTSITAGTNLTGGTITSTGTIALSATPSG